MTREEGFYWIRRDDKWEVAEYVDGDWFTAGNDTPVRLQDWDEILEIDEQRIIHWSENEKDTIL
jgi:hypothetical protein